MRNAAVQPALSRVPLGLCVPPEDRPLTCLGPESPLRAAVPEGDGRRLFHLPNGEPDRSLMQCSKVSGILIFDRLET